MAAPRARQVLRQLAKAVASVVSFAVVATIVALVIALDTDWGREQVRARAEAELAGAFVGGASIGELDISWRGEITAHDIVIRAPDGTTAIAIGTLRGKVALAPLLDREVDVADAFAEDVAVTVDRAPDGDIPIADLLVPGPPSPWQVHAPRVEVRGS